MRTDAWSRTTRFAAAAALVVSMSIAGCHTEPGPDVGDPCTRSLECARKEKVVCITNWPGGYCTETPCVKNECPAGSRCVNGTEFVSSPLETFCLEDCMTDTDCRDGYRCLELTTREHACTPIPEN